MISEQYDLIIVGGGLGGSSLAASIAKRGARVLLLERERQFKDRVRGECVFPWGVAEAIQLDVLELLRDRCAHELPWMDFYSGDVLTVHRPVAATTPQQLPCITFYHPTMQELLIGAAVSAGACVRRGVSVKEVRPGNPATVIVGDNRHDQEIRARLVVGADGRSSCARSSAGFQLRRDPEDLLVAGVLLEDIGAPEDTGQIVFNYNFGELAILLPQGEGRARTYFCFHAGAQPRYHGTADFPRYLDSFKRAGMNPEFYDGAKAAGPLATFDGAEAWVEHPYRDGVALIGDAAAASDPTWGQGLSLTLRDARVLRDQLLGTEDWETAGHAYAREHDRHTEVSHAVNLWFAEFYLETGPQADARRARALPLIAEDPSRQPDAGFSGPDIPVNDAVKKRFFAED
jgi:2-polyprenyl-6-methoxyphenol hydroxylase-like FAD-dependent oxidoreductase